MFANIPRELIERCFKYMAKLEFYKNYIIYKEGDIPENLYFIREGQVEVIFLDIVTLFLFRLVRKRIFHRLNKQRKILTDIFLNTLTIK